MKKFVLVGALCAFITGFAAADWHKVIFAGLDFTYANQKVEPTIGDTLTVNSFGAGETAGYVSANKENGFAFAVNESFNFIGTNDLSKKDDLGCYFNTFGGVGFAPLRNDKFLLAITGGIGFDGYTYWLTEKDFNSAYVGINFLVGADVAFGMKLSKRVGIGFNLLGTFAVAGCELYIDDVDKVEEKDKLEKSDCEVYFLKAGSFSVMPSICVTVHF